MPGGRPVDGARNDFAEVLSPDVIAKKTDKNYDLVRCKFCLAMHTLNPTKVSKPPAISSRLGTLQKHLTKCEYAIAAKGGDLAGAHVSPFVGWRVEDKLKLHDWVFDFVAQNKLPPTVTTSLSFHRLVEGICPGAAAYIPSYYQLRGPMLNARAEQCSQESSAELSDLQASTGGRVSILSDGWMNVAKKHVVGSQLVLFGKSHTRQLDDAGTNHDGLATAELLEKIVIDSIGDGFDVGCVVTDDAGQCKKARQLLRPRWPKVVFVACKAHDINNLVKQVLKLPTYKQVTAQASAAVNALTASSAKWLPLAQGVIHITYDLELKFHTLCATRWNSMHACFASLLRVIDALKFFHRIHHEHAKFPAECNVFSDDEFWARLLSAEKLIRPLAAISLVLQENRATPADVVHAFRKIFVTFALHDECASDLVACIESRWNNCEQPLFLLAYYLHPKYRYRAAEIKATGVTVDQICEIAIYYYRRFIGEDYGTLWNQLQWWFSLGDLRVRLDDFEPNVPLGYWQRIKNGMHGNRAPDLARLAIIIHSISVNTASCERLFSDLGTIHSKCRNRMDAETSLKWHLVQKRMREEDDAVQGPPRKRQRVLKADERRKHANAPVSTPPRDYVVPVAEPDATANHAREPRGDDNENGLPEETVEDRVLDTYDFWQSALDVILADQEVADDYLEQAALGNTCVIDQYEAIDAEPENGPFMEGMPEEKTPPGTRGVKWSLANLFPLA